MQKKQTGPLHVALLLMSFFVHEVYGQTSTVNGVAVYSGTPVRTNPLGIPTLSYNCAKLPSICNNVHAVYPLNAGTVAGTKTTLQNRQYVELNIDRDTDRKEVRRSEVCPDYSWKRNHACPEQDQPPVVPQPFDTGARSYSGGFVGQRLHPNTSTCLIQDYALSYLLKLAVDLTIADSNGADTGMAWSCDEFPPAL